MKLNNLRPMIWTENLNETVDFYVNILGFTCDEFSEEWQWASLSKDESELMFSAPNDQLPYNKIGFTGSFYFNVEDIDAIWNELKFKTTVCYEIESFEYGMREFAIYDNNGYLLQFGQEL